MLAASASSRWFSAGLATTGLFSAVLFAARVIDAAEPATMPAATQPNAATQIDAVTQPAAPAPLVTVAEPHVLIVSIDGLRPDCLLRADTPTIRSLMARGSFTLWARTTDVAVTTPSHVSMLTGVTPERHGISFNSDPPEGARILVPTIFDFASRAGISTAMASGKRKFSLFNLTNALTYPGIAPDPSIPDEAVAVRAVEIIRNHKPRLMAVHFAGSDVAGHGKGWGTSEQLDAISGIDRQLANVLGAYEAAGLAEETYIILSSDHGGSVRTHGRDDPRSRYIPWIFVGPGVRQNYDLTRLGRDYDIATYDTFATAMFLLGLPVPADSDGKPILPAFSEYDLMTADALPGAATRPVARQ